MNSYNFVKIIETLIDIYQADIFLMSHSNGFDIPPSPFVLRHGRDFPVAEQLSEILIADGYGASVTLFKEIYTPEQTKAIISHFDILISGRMHGAVAGLSQNIPTLIIDYGHEPKAHKLRGFAEIVGMPGIIADPNDVNDLIVKAQQIINERNEIRKNLQDEIPCVIDACRKHFDKIAEVFCENDFYVLESFDEILSVLTKFQKDLFVLSKNSEYKEYMAEKFLKKGVVIVRKVNGIDVGFCAFYANDDEGKTAYISFIAVERQYRNQGYGTALLYKVLEIARKSGMERIKLEVDDSNLTAVKFYKKNGFFEYMPAGESSHYLVKKITPIITDASIKCHYSM